MSKKSNIRLLADRQNSVPAEVNDILAIIKSNQIDSWIMEKSANGAIKFQASTAAGNSIIIEKRTVGSYSRTTTEKISRPDTISERRKIAGELRKEGMTQKEIAARTGCSQKTVSNDLKALG